ncbi:glycosyltransferase family 39 protein [Granulicella sp. 5B5]|nr:glycosyltransferase family 39 protein [Granulicella sp. 5B5]QMV20237.1 glycosyltransferase family 39 protein [Granulicella sp. 5B5]
MVHTRLGLDLGELAVLLVFSCYFLFYGLVPLFGGDQLGLVGADEPRYAQIAREMLAAHSTDCHEVHARITPHSLRLKDLRASYVCLTGGTITPILYGKPWLEKPALYYWRTMGFYKELGVSDWSARIPSATGALALIILAFLHLRRFRPGGHLDAALIMVSCVAIVAFARGASTDMQLAAPFCIGMLGWYAWYETGKKFWLFDLYFFNAAATLAKGPVAPFMALVIICLFLGLRREWSALRRTIWIPGVLLYFAMVLPWYIAVQRRNPTFFREFFLEHNLERYATDLYRHHQPAYYYIIVLILGLMPWTVLSIRALIDGLQISIAEWAVRFKPQRYVGHVRAGDAFPEFLVLWALFPIIFFSFSGSKLPGYILPSIPPLAILTGDYLFRIRRTGIPAWLLYAHAAATGVITFVLLLCPQYMVYQRIIPAPIEFVKAAIGGILAALLVIIVVRRNGVQLIRTATLIPLALLLYFLLGRNGHLLDLNYSARPLAREIAKAAPDVTPVAELDVRRDLVYGLAFYRNQEVLNYANDGIPSEEHILVIPTHDTGDLDHLLQGRVYQQLFLYETQGLSVYKVYPRS